MTFDPKLFDEFLRELGEMVRLRNHALAHPQVAGPALSVALRALARAEDAVSDAAETGGAEAELQSARNALMDARLQFRVVTRLLLETGRTHLDRPAYGN